MYNNENGDDCECRGETVGLSIANLAVIALVISLLIGGFAFQLDLLRSNPKDGKGTNIPELCGGIFLIVFIPGCFASGISKRKANKDIARE